VKLNFPVFSLRDEGVVHNCSKCEMGAQSRSSTFYHLKIDSKSFLQVLNKSLFPKLFLVVISVSILDIIAYHHLLLLPECHLWTGMNGILQRAVREYLMSHNKAATKGARATLSGNIIYESTIFQNSIWVTFNASQFFLKKSGQKPRHLL